MRLEYFWKSRVADKDTQFTGIDNYRVGVHKAEEQYGVSAHLQLLFDEFVMQFGAIVANNT